MKKAYAYFLILLVILSAMGLDVSKANPYAQVPTLSILSPYSSTYTCYSNASIPVKIGLLLPETSDIEESTPKISYSLDNGENTTLTNITKGEQWAKENPMQPPASFSVNSTLYNLTEGNHTLNAYSVSPDGKVLSDELIFTVDSSYITPKLTLLSPQNKTYAKKQVPILFTINAEYKDAKYMLDYDSVTSQTVLITGNATLTNLSEGRHKIMVFASFSDKYHMGTPTGQGTSFSIDTTKPQNNLGSDNQATITALTILAIAILATIILFYRRRKRQG